MSLADYEFYRLQVSCCTLLQVGAFCFDCVDFPVNTVVGDCVEAACFAPCPTKDAFWFVDALRLLRRSMPLKVARHLLPIFLVLTTCFCIGSRCVQVARSEVWL